MSACRTLRPAHNRYKYYYKQIVSDAFHADTCTHAARTKGESFHSVAALLHQEFSNGRRSRETDLSD